MPTLTLADAEAPPQSALYRWGWWFVQRTTSGAASVLAVLAAGGVLVLAMLPLSFLLLILPAFFPEEAVLTDVNRRERSWWQTLGKGLFALLVSIAAIEAQVIFAIEATYWLEQAGIVSSKPELLSFLWNLFLTKPEIALLPTAVANHPTLVLLLIYLLDLVLLFIAGKVPLNYNLRNMAVRWPITALTATAFVVVVALMVAMLAFVNGMNEMTTTSGNPANVLALSEGSTDENFSDLGYKDLDKVGLVVCTLNEMDFPLPTPVTIAKAKINDKDTPLSSRETYFTINQAITNADGTPTGKRRFVQFRGIYDPEVSGRVHDLQLEPGGRWFSPSGVGKDNVLECVMGSGIASELGNDRPTGRLQVGDTFALGDRQWIVTGIIKGDGTTFGSEIWGKQQLLCQLFGKVNSSQSPTSTTLVLRVDPPNQASARVMTYHLNNRYKEQSLRVMTESDYYARLAETSKQLLFAIIFVAVVMAIGGIFGVMNTMFAAIAQRTKDIGVMRIIGFKRWQVVVSFMLESLAIALLGGLVGCAIGYIADGFTATSILSSGQGGGKSVVLRLTVGPDILIFGIVFTLVMGRLGGLLPALSAMRLKILDSLR
jgi:hypothetical protein